MNFDAFNIVSIPMLKNAAADLLAMLAARLVPTNNQCSIELISRLDVPDNIMNLRVFDDDLQILEFLTNDENFKGSVIDDKNIKQAFEVEILYPKELKLWKECSI